MIRLREHTEKLQAQEEVMRQNMEEMAAMRDELQRQQPAQPTPQPDAAKPKPKKVR